MTVMTTTTTTTTTLPPEVESLPLSLAWLCDAPPEARSEKRATVAESLLRLMDDPGADHSSLPVKFAKIFRPALTE
eukprot:8202141-Pyramimonas_sp.AAC.1